MQFEFRLSSLCLAGAFGRIAPMQKSVGLCDRDRGSSWFASSEASTHSRAERAKHANSTRESHSLSSMMSSDSKGSRPRMTEIDSITVRTSMEYKPMAIRVPLIFARRVRLIPVPQHDEHDCGAEVEPRVGSAVHNLVSPVVADTRLDGVNLLWCLESLAAALGKRCVVRADAFARSASRGY